MGSHWSLGQHIFQCNSEIVGQSDYKLISRRNLLPCIMNSHVNKLVKMTASKLCAVTSREGWKIDLTGHTNNYCYSICHFTIQMLLILYRNGHYHLFWYKQLSRRQLSLFWNVVSISNNVLKLCFHWVNQECLCESYTCRRESSSWNENCVLSCTKWNISVSNPFGVNAISALNLSLKGVAGCHSNHFESKPKKLSSLYDCNRTQLIFLRHI